MVLKQHYPPDIRVDKEAKALSARGHDVHLLAEGLPSQPSCEVTKNMRIHRVRTLEPLSRRLNWIKFYVLNRFIDEYWKKCIDKFVLKEKIECLHIHDLPLLGTALEVSSKYDLPVVIDLHENYPECVKATNVNSRNPLVWFTENRRRWAIREARWVPNATKVITVAEEERERLIHQYDLTKSDVSVLMNVEDFDTFVNSKNEIKVNVSPNFIISYIGGISPHRGLDTAIEAMAHLTRWVPESRLRIVGATNHNRPILEKWVERNEVYDVIEILDWQPFEEIPRLIMESNVCLVPHHRTPHTDIALPHKLFQYMILGKPVVGSDCPALKRVINDTGGGLVFEGGNPKDLAEKILEIYKLPSLAKKLGRNGFESVKERYNWANESRKLIEVYTDLEKMVAS
jgi:glycosyltransferase involved in cell wall biosynthesis